MPRSFQELIGQDRAARMLTTFIRRQTVPHALLFVGIDGVGKRTAARIFAAAANCEGDPETPLPCGECRPCRKIEGDRHPCFLDGRAQYEGADVLVLPSFNRFVVGTPVNGMRTTDSMSPLLTNVSACRPVVRTDGETLRFPRLEALGSFL